MLFKNVWKKKEDIQAVTKGTQIPVQDVNDEIFAQQLLGKTLALQPKGDVFVAPVDGILEVLYPSGHAFAIRMKNGGGILVHIGIDTVSFHGEGFQTLCKQGDIVKAGQPIVEINRETLIKKGADLTTMLIITQLPEHKKDVKFTNKTEIEMEDEIGSFV